MTRNRFSSLAQCSVYVGIAFAPMEEALPQIRVPSIVLRVEPITSTIQAYEPLILRVTAVNESETPVSVMVRNDGAICDIRVRVIAPGGQSSERNQSLWYESEPCTRMELKPKRETDGEVLVFLDGPPTGAAFPTPGVYKLGVIWEANGSAAIDSELVTLLASTDTHGNRKVLQRLTDEAFRYYEWDRTEVEKANGRDALMGLELLKQIVRLDAARAGKGAKDESAKDQTLLSCLESIVTDFPDSPYAGYAARHVGLSYERTLGSRISREDSKDAGERGGLPNRDPARFLNSPEYKAAMHFNDIAMQWELWPRTSALHAKGRLLTAAQQWEKVDEVIKTLRTKYAPSDGDRVADELQKHLDMMRSYIETLREQQKTNDR